jgi:hypothetical protein
MSQKRNISKVLPQEKRSFLYRGVILYLPFENEQKLLKCLNHQIHKKVVEDALKPLVRKTVVYGFIAQTAYTQAKNNRCNILAP